MMCPERWRFGMPTGVRPRTYWLRCKCVELSSGDKDTARPHEEAAGAVRRAFGKKLNHHELMTHGNQKPLMPIRGLNEGLAPVICWRFSRPGLSRLEKKLDGSLI